VSTVCLAVPGRVVAVHDRAGMPMGQVDLGGADREVSLLYVPEVVVGDWVVVHLGMALRRLDEPEALETLALLEGLGPR
jgi:hydrogenase expression/formation protein HypC